MPYFDGLQFYAKAWAEKRPRSWNDQEGLADFFLGLMDKIDLNEESDQLMLWIQELVDRAYEQGRSDARGRGDGRENGGHDG